MFEKHLWKSDILRKDAGHRPGNIVTLVENGLICKISLNIRGKFGYDPKVDQVFSKRAGGLVIIF